MKLFKRVAAFMSVVLVAGLLAAPAVAKAANEIDIKLDPSVTESWVNNLPGSYAQELQVLAVMNEATDVTKVCGISITFKNPDLSNGAGGMVVFGGTTNGWWNSDTNSTQAFEFGNQDKRVNMVKIEGTDDYKITFLNDAPIFPDNETAGQAVIRQYWGAPLVVSYIELLGANGTVLAKAGTASAPAVVEPIKAGDTINLATDERVVRENLADGVQDKEMTLNGTKISDKVIGLKPVTDTNSKVAYTVTVDKAGKYDLEVVYNAKGDKRPMAVKVNDGKATDVALASTGDDYLTCGTVKVTVELKAGENTITFSQASTYDNSTVKAPNLVTAKVVAQAAQQPATGVSSMAIIVCGIAVLLCAAAVTFTAKKRA